jgi:hypothetical protein
MKTSPKHSPRGSISLSHHTESIHVDSAEIDEAKSPHAIDSRDPNYDPFDEEEVEIYMTTEDYVGSLPHHVVRSTKMTPMKSSRFATSGIMTDRFGMPITPSSNQVRDMPIMSMKKFKAALDAALEELFTSSDFAQFTERLELLGCKLYHDEMIAHVIRVSLDMTDSERDKVAELITLLRKSGHVSSGQLSRAFEKLFLSWEDILLDAPSAVGMIERFVELAIADGLVQENFLSRLPEAFVAKLGSSADDQQLCPDTYPSLVEQLKDVKEFKRKCSVLLEEYYAGEGAEPASEFSQRLAEIGKASFRHEFIRRAINISIDKRDTERELTSSLLSKLRDLRILTEDDFLWGFSHMLGSLPELSIDCPAAIELVSKFLIRGVTDEVIPPSFLENAIRLGLGGEEGTTAAKKAQAAVENTEVEWADLRNVWGKLNGSDDEKWRNELDLAIREYLDSHDKAEFCRILHEWGLCTSEAIIVVKQVLLKAMDGNGNDCMAVVDLLDYAVKHEELKSSDILRAMNELDSNLQDLQLDVPDAKDMLDTFGGLLRSRGLLPLPSPRSSAASLGSR